MPRMRKSLLIKALLIKPQLILALALFAGGASAAEYWIGPQDEVFGEVQVVAARYEDTFVSLARTYNVGYEALRRANPHVDPWLPGEGTKIVIPTQFVLPRAPNRGIVVNVAELRLYYFPAASSVAPEGTPAGSRRVITHPISIGRMDWSTPLGATSVTGKVANPSWTPPQSIRDEHAARNDILPRVVPAGPRQSPRQACTTSRASGLSDPRNEQAVRRGDACDSRLHPNVPGGHRSALQDRACGNTGDDRESAVQARLDRRWVVSRSASTARERARRRNGGSRRAEQHRYGRGGAGSCGRISDGAHARVRRRDGFENGRRSLGFRRNGFAVGSRRPRVHLGRGRSRRRNRVLRRRSRDDRGFSPLAGLFSLGKKKPPTFGGLQDSDAAQAPHPII